MDHVSIMEYRWTNDNFYCIKLQGAKYTTVTKYLLRTNRSSWNYILHVIHESASSIYKQLVNYTPSTSTSDAKILIVEWKKFYSYKKKTLIIIMQR